jgi:hypothetical protein
MARSNRPSVQFPIQAPPPPSSGPSLPRSPSFSSFCSSDSDSTSLQASADPRLTLHRVLCLRCAKRLEKDPSVECDFSNPRSAKCNRCVVQKNRCRPVSSLIPSLLDPADPDRSRPLMCQQRRSCLAFMPPTSQARPPTAATLSLTPPVPLPPELRWDLGGNPDPTESSASRF